jgi:DNA-binding transcriptional regulator YhcF (GntR family)/predicted enzyme related to lactoylglutathione lyase
VAGLDPDDSRPPYVQVAAALRASIRNGALQPGGKLPSGSELAQRYGVARMTVQNAIRLLRSEGLVVTRQGSGVYVRTRPASPIHDAALMWLHLDCRDPAVLAEFYHQLLGWDVVRSDAEHVVITDGSLSVCFARVDNYQAPGWPDSAAPKRYHFDLKVADLPAAVARCLELGAGKPEFQPGGDRWTVLTDPEGHPFCLCV